MFYTLPEYIVARKSSSIIKHIIQNNTSVKTSLDSDYVLSKTQLDFEPTSKELLHKTNTLELMMNAVFIGARSKRFLFLELSTNTIFQINLFEIHEPSHCYIPIIITRTSVFMISPFGVKYDDETEFVRELFPTSILESADDVSKILSEKLMFNKSDNEKIEMTVEEAFRYTIEYFIASNTESDELLVKNFKNIDTTLLREIDTESVEWQTIKDKYSSYAEEAILEFDERSSINSIHELDYLPICLSLQGKDKVTGFVKIDYNFDNNYNTIIRNIILTDSLEDDEQDQYYRSVVLSKPYRDKGSLLIHLDSLYYIGGNKVSSPLPEAEVYDLWDIYDKDIIENDSGITSGIATEGFLGDLFKFTKALGIKAGSVLYSFFVTFSKAPKSAFKFIWDSIKSTRVLASNIEDEKDEALRIQEKVLNDELDHGEELTRGALKAGLRGWALTALTGQLWLLPFLIKHQKARVYKNRLRGVERTEFRLDAIIDRMDTRIDAAKSEGDTKKVDLLMKEKSMYEFSKLKLIEFKREIIEADRIKYRTFDKDNTLTARHRLDAMVQSGGYYNIHGEYGKDFLKDD